LTGDPRRGPRVGRTPRRIGVCSRRQWRTKKGLDGLEDRTSSMQESWTASASASPKPLGRRRLRASAASDIVPVAALSLVALNSRHLLNRLPTDLRADLSGQPRPDMY
jgi:hypothetical protein